MSAIVFEWVCEGSWMGPLRSRVLFFHLAFCIFGTRYVKAWNEVITSYLFCQKATTASSLVFPHFLFASALLERLLSCGSWWPHWELTVKLREVG